MSIRTRIYALVAVALVPSLVMLALNVTNERSQRYRDIHTTALRIGQLGSLEMQRIVGGAQDLLTAVAAEPAVRAFDVEACRRFLDEVAVVSPQLHSVAAIDATGRIRCRSTMAGGEVDASKRGYFAEVMATNGFVVGHYLRSDITGASTLPMAVPIRGRLGTARGVLVGGLDLAWLDRVMAERSLPRNDSLTIIDRDGVIVARKPLADEFVGIRVPDAFQHLINAETPDTLEITSQDGTRRVIGYYPTTVEPFGLYVSAGIAIDEMMAPADREFVRDMLIVLMGMAASFAAATAVGAQLVNRPINVLKRTIERWRRGDEHARTGMGEARNELHSIGAAVDRLMDDVVDERNARRETEARERLLARELEHRVKNLLTTVQALAGHTFRTQPDVAAGLETFSSRLAALARSQEMLIRNAWKRADLLALADEVVAPFGAENFRISGGPLLVRERAASALALALHEFCTNASKYGALSLPDGYVRLSWSVEGDVFRLRWSEHDGPAVTGPTEPGFGSTLVEISAASLGGTVVLDFATSGVRAAIDAPAAAVLAEDVAAAD